MRSGRGNSPTRSDGPPRRLGHRGRGHDRPPRGHGTTGSVRGIKQLNSIVAATLRPKPSRQTSPTALSCDASCRTLPIPSVELVASFQACTRYAPGPWWRLKAIAACGAVSTIRGTPRKRVGRHAPAHFLAQRKKAAGPGIERRGSPPLQCTHGRGKRAGWGPNGVGVSTLSYA